MQRFTNSIIKLRRNRFSETNTRFDFIPITNIDFGNSLNSFKDKDNFFTNYVNTPDKKIYQYVQQLYDKYVNNENFLNNFISDELYYNRTVADRLICIINLSCSTKYTKDDLKYIYKLKSASDKNLHIYIKVSRGNVKMLLIDLYHLSLPADLIKNNIVVRRGSIEELKRKYLKYESCNYNLNNIINREN